MSQKKIFLVVVAISTVSFLLHHGGHLSWTMEALHLGCPAACPPLPLSPFPGGGPPRPPKRTSVVFLKTHKTASTTMQNLLFRFAERHNLTVALPVPACGHQFCYPAPFSARFVHPHTLPADVVTSHMRFGRAELRRLMPNDTAFVTILREPAAMFESLFGYYNQNCQTFRRVPNASLDAFLDEPWRYYRPGERDSMYARNTLTFDLGGDKDRAVADEGYARAFVAEVERSFSLVMIAEHFDESLVLLRRLLSWDLEDVLYVKLNMRTPASHHFLSTGTPARIRAWNHLDARLYHHFNASLWRRLEVLGPACVAREVALLRRANERLVRGCFRGGLPRLRPAAQIQNKDLRPWQPSAKVDIVGYDLPPDAGGAASDACLRLVTPELQYTRVLLRAQSLRYRRVYQARTPQLAAPPRPATPRRRPVAAAAGGRGEASRPPSSSPPPPPPPAGPGSRQGPAPATPPLTQGRTTGGAGVGPSQRQVS